MTTIPIRTLNQDTAGVLARVENGESVGITRHGRLVARIVPVQGNELEDLVAEGLVVPATVSAPFDLPVGPPADSDSGALLEEMRDEERW